MKPHQLVNEKRKLWMAAAIAGFILLKFSSTGFAQEAEDHAMHQAGTDGLAFWFGLLELPFLLLCVYFAFKTASALRGGAFGNGMNLMAWGFLVMAVGHLHMQIDHFMGYNIFNQLLGETLGLIIWFIALVGTWSLSGLGFYKIYKASSQA